MKLAVIWSALLSLAIAAENEISTLVKEYEQNAKTLRNGLDDEMAWNESSDWIWTVREDGSTISAFVEEQEVLRDVLKARQALLPSALMKQLFVAVEMKDMNLFTHLKELIKEPNLYANGLFLDEIDIPWDIKVDGLSIFEKCIEKNIPLDEITELQSPIVYGALLDAAIEYNENGLQDMLEFMMKKRVLHLAFNSMKSVIHLATVVKKGIKTTKVCKSIIASMVQVNDRIAAKLYPILYLRFVALLEAERSEEKKEKIKQAEAEIMMKENKSISLKQAREIEDKVMAKKVLECSSFPGMTIYDFKNEVKRCLYEKFKVTITLQGLKDTEMAMYQQYVLNTSNSLILSQDFEEDHLMTVLGMLQNNPPLRNSFKNLTMEHSEVASDQIVEALIKVFADWRGLEELNMQGLGLNAKRMTRLIKKGISQLSGLKKLQISHNDLSSKVPGEEMQLKSAIAKLKVERIEMHWTGIAASKLKSINAIA